MGQDYSYTQPSQSEDYGLGSADSAYNETEHDIQLDQAEIEAARVHYPPQPEVEFGFPSECYYGGEPHVATSYTRVYPGRRFYTCGNVDNGDCHVWKWWDLAATEEIRDLRTQYVMLSDKVDSVSFNTEYDGNLREFKDQHDEMERKLVKLERTLERKLIKLERSLERKLVVGFIVFVVLIIGVVIGGPM